jgi:hypothetical protein
MFAWALACSAPPPAPPADVLARAWGGGDGVHLVLTGDLVAELTAPGATAEALAAITRTPDRDPCPGDAVRFRRGAEAKPSVRACGSPLGAAWKGAVVEEVSVDLSDGAMWVDAYLADAPRHLRAEIPFDRKVGLSGTQRAALDWTCLGCGADRPALGHGELDLSWGFDAASARSWSFPEDP